MSTHHIPPSTVDSVETNRALRSMRAHPTLESVGELAGVSRSTVSRVINGSPGVSGKAAQAVMDAIQTLGYFPNQMAKSLASSKASVVTALIPENVDHFFADPFFRSVILGIERRLAATDLVLNLMIAAEASFPKMLSTLAGGHSDGVIVLSHHVTHELVEVLERHVPVVYGGRPVNDSGDRSFVDVDNVAAARTATQHLVDRGCRRIAMIGGPEDMLSTVDRRTGFEQVTSESGTRGPIASGDYGYESGTRAARELLESGQSFDGVFIASDLMARAAVDVFLASGLSIPEDLAVVGFDDSYVATSAKPYLTTIRQDACEQGSVMVDLLTERLAGREPRVVYLPTELVRRDTA